eukprot:COSAG06_NODE_1011_length_11045_cov_6.246723_5_plen_87_part_00
MIERDAAAAAAGVDLNRVPNWRPAPPAEGEAPIGAYAINRDPRPQACSDLYLNDETARFAQTSYGRTGRETAHRLVLNSLLVLVAE